MAGNNPNVEQIDEKILKMLNLEDTFDLDYDTYFTLVKEKLVEVSRGENIPAEEVMLLQEELKRAKEKKKTGGRFKPEKKKIKKESITSIDSLKLNQQKSKPLLLSGSSVASKEKEEIKEEKKEEDNSLYNSIIKSLDNIISILSRQLKFDQKESEKKRKTEEKEKRKSKEGALESAFSKGVKALSEVGKKILSPFQDLIQRLINFVSWIFFGKLFMNLLDWFNDPKNESKVKTLGKLLETFWPAILAAILLFTNPFGKFVRVIIGMIVRWTWRIAKFAIPKLLKFLAKNKKAVAAVALFTAGATIPSLFPQTVDAEEKKTEAAPGSKEDKINQLKNQKENLNWFQKNVQGMGSEIDEQIYNLENGTTKSYPSFSQGGITPIDHGYNGIDSNTGESITGAGRDTQLIAARPGEVVLTPEDQKFIYKNTGFDVKQYVSARPSKFINSSNINFSTGSYSDGGIIQKFDAGGIVNYSGLENSINQSTQQYKNQPPNNKETSLGIPLIKNNPIQSLQTIMNFAAGSAGFIPGAAYNILNESIQMLPRKEGGGILNNIFGGLKTIIKPKKRVRDIRPGVGDWERSGKQNWNKLKSNAPTDLLYMDQFDFGQSPINESSYTGRIRSGKSSKRGVADNPNYVGPLGFAGRGTKDRMPGTTPENNSTLGKIGISSPISHPSKKAYGKHLNYFQGGGIVPVTTRTGIDTPENNSTLGKIGISSPISHPSKKAYGKHLNYFQGGGIVPVTTRTGIDIKGGVTGADTQYFPNYNVAVQPGEEIFKYVITKDAAEKGAGSTLLNFAENLTANLDSNSNAAKMGRRNVNMSLSIRPYSNSGSGDVNISTLPLSGVGGVGGGIGASPGGSKDYFHSPISQSGLSERQRILDILGVSAFD